MSDSGSDESGDGGPENAGYQRMFGDEDLTVGLYFPFTGDGERPPAMDRELALAERAEACGIDALWVRDIPTFWPRFGEAGQVHDPWVFLSQVAARTDRVALATGSIVLPLRHPLHVAKAAASLDCISGGRVVLGVGSGDRDPECAAFGVTPEERGELFRESVDLLRRAWREPFPEHDSTFGTLDGTLDLRPKPTTETLPLLVTGHARQSLSWIGEHGDGWLFYWLPERTREGFIADWRGATPEPKPFVQALRVGLAPDHEGDPEHVHGGFRADSEFFVEYLRDLDTAGVDHVAVGLVGDDPGEKLEAFAETVLSRV